MDGVKMALGNREMTVEAVRQCAKDRKEWIALDSSVFPNTHAWEQQERNKTKRHTKMVRRGVGMERRKAGTNKRSLDGQSHPNQNTIIINKIR